jgi:multidrug resistance efflux pump
MRTIFTLLLGSALLVACTDSPTQPNGNAPASAAAAPTNRVDVPSTVRQNLGITFAKVEQRSVAQSIRLPGQFELVPDAKREYHAMVDGRVDLLVSQYQKVDQGMPLYRLHSPRWRDLQQQLADAQGAMRLAKAGVDTIGPLKAAHAQHEVSLRETVDLWKQRVEQLEGVRSAGGGRAEEFAQARASLTAAQAELAEILEKDAELDAREAQVHAELASASAKFDLLLATASTLLSINREQLAQTAESTPDAPPTWRTIDVVEVLATTPGVVDRLMTSNGSWIDQASPVLTTIEPTRVRFRARGLQSDLARLRDGLPAEIVTAQSTGAEQAARVAGTLVLAPTADAAQRTVDLIVTPSKEAPWARSGVSAYLEVALDGGSEELAIPLACVTRDGLASIIFRRDPRDPDKVIRLEADLGIDDGRWVVVRSGVKAGDEIVLDGVYQLMVATSGTIAKGGHFHADGTFHEGDQ